MANESRKVRNLTTWILSAMLIIITSMSGIIYADMKSDFGELKTDFKSMDKKLDVIKEKVDKRDAVDTYIIRDIEDLKKRVRILEAR